MDNVEQGSCVVAREVNGRPAFIELDGHARQAVGGISTSWFWAAIGTPRLPGDIGLPPVSPTFPGPGGSKFGLISLPARCETGLHATVSVDFEVIVSGQVVLELPGDQSRVLGPGDSVVLAGVTHRWRNSFDEACVWAAFIVGAEAS